MAAGLAELGHQVAGLDRSESLVEALSGGDVHILEPGLPELVDKGTREGRLCFTTSYPAAIGHADFIFLAVDTPQTLAGAADLRNIRGATRSIAGALNGRNPVVINKSTSPIGTGETIETILSETLAQRQYRPRIVSNPEFLRQGRAVEDFFNPDRIVVGAHDPADAQAVAELYRDLGGTVILTSLRTAEMIKYVSNSFLATRISFINEIARLCDQIGIDVDEVVEGISHDPRVGRHFFHPGIGFGGSCLPKDVAALRYIGEAVGVATPVLSAVQDVNTAQRTSAVRKLRARLGGSLEDKTIAVWGLTFKGGTEDTRDSPAMDVVGLLRNDGANIQAYDPGVVGHEEQFPEALRSILRPTPEAAAEGADALAILTDWDAFTKVPLDEVRAVMRGSVLLDGRNLIPRASAEAAGFAYIGVGRRSTANRRRSGDG
ncbi:UDP-glucose/GDP-mannose dehydrogenase family protein [soil metagenome]